MLRVCDYHCTGPQAEQLRDGVGNKVVGLDVPVHFAQCRKASQELDPGAGGAVKVFNPADHHHAVVVGRSTLCAPPPSLPVPSPPQKKTKKSGSTPFQTGFEAFFGWDPQCQFSTKGSAIR